MKGTKMMKIPDLSIAIVMNMQTGLKRKKKILYGDQEGRTNHWSRALVGIDVVSLFLCMTIKNTSDIERRKVTGNKRI